MKDLARTIKAMLSAFNMADIGSGLKTQTAKVTLFNLHTGKQVHDNEVASLAAELNVPNLKDAGVDNEDIQEFIKARKAAGVSATNIPTVPKNTGKATYDEDGSANESAEDIEIQHVQHQLAHLDINVVRVENKGEKHLVVVDRDDLLLANATLRHLGVDDEFVAIAEGVASENSNPDEDERITKMLADKGIKVVQINRKFAPRNVNIYIDTSNLNLRSSEQLVSNASRAIREAGFYTGFTYKGETIYTVLSYVPPSTYIPDPSVHIGPPLYDTGRTVPGSRSIRWTGD